MLKEIGERIKFLREQKGLTLEQMAQELNISRQRLSRMEKGCSDISLEMAYKIADILKVDYKTIFEVEKPATNIAYRQGDGVTKSFDDITEMINFFYANKHLYVRMNDSECE